MYKVQNTMSGNLPIDLEIGSITLSPGQTFDLDLHCSRKWMKTNAILARLLAVGALRLIHDSLVSIPKAPIKKVTVIDRTTLPKAVQKPVAKPTAVAIPKKPKVKDLSDKEAPTAQKYKKAEKTKEEDPVEQSLTNTKEEKPKRTYFGSKSETQSEEDSEKKTKKKKRYSKKYDD